jgi:hypothetical protein
MKKCSVILFAVFSIFTFAQPKLEMEKAVHDFGDIEKGAKVETVFKFKNVGTAPLTITDVGTSCGCTTAKPEKTVYQVGESGEIPVEFNSQRFSGNITKRITISTNDEANPKTVVTIKGFVTVDVEYKPSSIFIANAKMGKTVTQEIMVSTAKMEKLDLSNVQVRITPDCLTAEVVRVDDKNSKIIVTADGSKFATGKSRFSGFLTFDTNSDTQKNLRLPITVHVARAIKASPNSVYFFASKAGKTRQVTVKVTSNEGKPFKITEMISSLDFITMTEEKDEGTVKTLTATLSDSAPVGKFTGTIKVKLDLPEQPEIVIPLRGSVI